MGKPVWVRLPPSAPRHIPIVGVEGRESAQRPGSSRSERTPTVRTDLKTPLWAGFQSFRLFFDQQFGHLLFLDLGNFYGQDALL